MNCWEFKNCGSEKNCPAYPENGRICFSVTKTMCGGEIQGGYLEKRGNCRDCQFYKKFIIKQE